jgi:hypothetical protein
VACRLLFPGDKPTRPLGNQTKADVITDPSAAKGIRTLEIKLAATNTDNSM